MDELDKLKGAWESSLSGNEKEIDASQLQEIIKKRSQGPVEKLKRSLYIEIGTIILVLPFLVYMIFRLPEIYFIINTLIIIVCFVVILIYYYTNLQKVTRIWGESQTNLRKSLEGMLVLFRFFRKSYYYINIALFPFGLYFGFVLGFGLGSDGQKVTSLILFENESLLFNIIFWAAILIFAVVFFFLFLKFYVKKLYDIHIQKIELILKELTENDN